jgi:hypothetical protein
VSDEEPTYDTSCPQCGGPSRVIEGIYKCRYVSVRAKERQDATIAALRLALDAAEKERDEAHAKNAGLILRVAGLENELRDTMDDAQTSLLAAAARVAELERTGIEFASQYGSDALKCRFDNSCDDSGRELPCVPCGFRRALAPKEERG